jgi:hypothetical protein
VAIKQSLIGTHGSLQAEAPFPAVVESKVENLAPLGVESGVAIFHGSDPTFLSHSKHSELGFPCLSQDAVFGDCAHTVIIHQRLSPCQVFKG